MSKYIPKSANTRMNSVYHVDENCRRLKKEPREATENEIEYHDLELCSWCDPDKNSPFENE